MATRDGELFKDKIEVSLDGRQIFCLFAGGAVIASLVFVLGVMVGRRVESRANPERSAAGAPSSDPLAALDQLAADGEPEAGETATDAQLPSALRDGQASPPAPVDQALAHAPAPLAAEPEPAPAARPEPKPEPAPAPKPEPVAAAGRPEPPKPAKPEPPKADGKGRFTLQLSSFQSRAEADAFIAELKKSGYAPTVTEANVEGKGTWFRVRVGAYGSYDQAVAAKADFEGKQKVIAYVTRVK